MNNANERYCCGGSFFTQKHGSENKLTSTPIPVTNKISKCRNSRKVPWSVAEKCNLQRPLKRTKGKTERTIRYFQIDVFIFKDLQKNLELKYCHKIKFIETQNVHN